MAKYLIKAVETLRVATEDEAKAVIEEAKKDRNFTLSKYSSEYKCSKAKGEVVDEWYRVILTKDFTSEKGPECSTTSSDNVELGAFPDPVSRDDEEDYDG